VSELLAHELDLADRRERSVARDEHRAKPRFREQLDRSIMARDER
jgi:hypothetical protein